LIAFNAPEDSVLQLGLEVSGVAIHTLAVGAGIVVYNFLLAAGMAGLLQLFHISRRDAP
jgi:hypothetical protein